MFIKKKRPVVADMSAGTVCSLVMPLENQKPVLVDR
jgi:hypothetical protein